MTLQTQIENLMSVFTKFNNDFGKLPDEVKALQNDVATMKTKVADIETTTMQMAALQAALYLANTPNGDAEISGFNAANEDGMAEVDEADITHQRNLTSQRSLHDVAQKLLDAWFEANGTKPDFESFGGLRLVGYDEILVENDSPPVWMAGGEYRVGDLVRCPKDDEVYRCIKSPPVGLKAKSSRTPPSQSVKYWEPAEPKKIIEMTENLSDKIDE